MACRLYGAKPLSKLMLGYCQFGAVLNQNIKLFIHKNVSENIVCEMAAILSRGRWFKSDHGYFEYAIHGYTLSSDHHTKGLFNGLGFRYYWIIHYSLSKDAPWLYRPIFEQWYIWIICNISWNADGCIWLAGTYWLYWDVDIEYDIE